ncbi:MAG: long-chain-fatty-acid--CoA ligase [Verrucomicrobiia bacterium]
MNLAKKFYQAAAQRPNDVAIYYGDDCVTYSLLAEQSLQIAKALIERYQVKKGDRIGLLMRNRPEFIPSLFGILSADAVVVPINVFLKPYEVSYIVNDAGIKVLITEDSLKETARKVCAECEGLKVLTIDGSLNATGELKSVLETTAAEQDLAIIIYTSGTTGHPKGAMLSHNNLLENVQSCYEALDLTVEERIAVILPMFHSFMMTVGILLPLFSGASIALIKSVHPIKNMLEELIARRATLLPAMPQVFRAFIHPSVPQQLPLRLCVSGSAPLPFDTLEQFNKKFQFPLIEGYGLSEASPVCSVNPIKGPWKAGSIGVPIPRVEMSIQDENGNHLPPGVVGEVCVKGGNVMLGYWNKPEETAKAFRNGWLLTGDVGYRDHQGYFYITDRKKDMLLVNGNNVYPREIEEVILTFPGIKEAAVIGRPDPRRGEQPVAYISPVEGQQINHDELIKFLRHRLADYKVPKRIITLAELPHNATGKILKTELRTRND